MLDGPRLPLALAGRVLLALMFILSGVDEPMHIEGDTASMAGVGLPAWLAFTVPVGLMEPIGGRVVATGFHALWAAPAWALVALAASLIHRHYGSPPADQPMVQPLLFMMNLAVAGGMRMVAAPGPGAASLGGQGGARRPACGSTRPQPRACHGLSGRTRRASKALCH